MKKLFPLVSIHTLILALSLFSAGLNAQSLQISQVKPDTYKISITSSPSKSNISWSEKPDEWKSSSKLHLKSQDELVELASAHPIVRLEVKGSADYYAAPRLLELRGAVNFRDLGGYNTTNNKEVKWGKIYRSADISKLTDDDLVLLTNLNIKVVCDLRGPAEVSASPDRLPAGISSLNLPAGSENTGTPGSFMKHIKTPESADSILRAVYVKNDFYKAKYKPMFDQLLVLEDDKSILFHCTAGKDRTGVGAALILWALGVDEPTIIKDYELTNEYRKVTNEATIRMITSQGIPEATARKLMAADPEYLRSCFRSLEKNYGSVDLFLEKEIGLTTEKKITLKEKFLY